MTLFRRLQCWLLGHPDNREVHWGIWKLDEEHGRYRELTEVCTRCQQEIAHHVQWESDVRPRRVS